MLEMLLQWYRRHFADPQAVALFTLLIVGFCIIFFFQQYLSSFTDGHRISLFT